MKRLLIFFMILTALGAPSLPLSVTPARAQETTADPAAYLPAQTSAYLEIRADDAALGAFDQLVSRLSALSGAAAPSEIGFADLLTGIFFGGDFRADVLPWLADRFAIAMVAAPVGVSPGAADFAFVLPIADSAGARAFVEQFAARTIERDVLPNGMLYFGGTFSMAANDQVIWLGAPNAVRLMLQTSSGSLAQNPAYQPVRAALPADALVTGYLSGAYIAETAAAQQAQTAPGFPTADALWEAALRLHPAQSAAEDALLQFPGLNGVGFALQASPDRLEVTAALSLDATYPAPTLATSTAGAALLSLIPGDSFAVFASYDLALGALPVAGLAYLGPAVGSVFSSIIVNLDDVTLLPTPTPTPTPTPPPPLTADAIIAQVQPFIAQATSLMGISLDELNRLIGGEYAVAVFPGAGPTIGAALYLNSSDPQRLIDMLDHVSKLILTDPTNGTPLVAVEHKTIDGLDVALLGTRGAGDRPALGIVGDHVLFLTLESTVSKVIAAARSQNPASPALGWRDAFGDGREALLYVDARTIDLYALGRQRIPPLPLTAVAASFDIRDDGLFVLSLTATISGE